MKKIFLFLMMMTTISGFAGNENPFFQKNNNPFGAPPFDKIKPEHYMPAFREGIKQHEAEIRAIVVKRSVPTFQNTIEPLEFGGQLLKTVSSVFFNLHSADTNDALDKIANEITPILSDHEDNIYMNELLFARIKGLYDNRDSQNLTHEQTRVLEKYYRNFIRHGAALDATEKAELRDINKELGLAELAFGQNVLAETNDYKKVVDNEADLAGLPESVRQAAAEAATAAGLKGKWVFTTHKASFIPVLQYSQNRQLRKDLLLAYAYRGDNGNKNDNNELINKIMKLRVRQAQLLGFKTPAAFILDDTMAKTPDNVYNFLNPICKAAVEKAKSEAVELQQLMDTEGKSEKLRPWDWWYYSEKVRKSKYDLDEEQLRPYFKLENVRKGVFDLATKLYGIKFRKLDNMPVYNPDVEVFEVTNADGSLVGILYTDYFPRSGKAAGAWMNNVTDQYVKDGKDHRPIICNVGNFTKPTTGKPSLLSMDEVETLFHEFGHALHGLLTKCNYPMVSGTNVPRDFVEMPSQIMENWCWEPDVMKTYAFHYQTGELMPEALMAKIARAKTFNQGFAMTELLAAALLDMDYHVKSDTATFDVTEFENASLANRGMISQIIVRYRSTYFNHVFTGDYAAGYYSYTWAEVLDADAFQAFKETGDVLNKKVADAFRANILEKGDSEDPMILYRKFRGNNPNPEALLKRRGLK